MAIVAESFSAGYAKRNKTPFILGVRPGFRIGELLSLRVGDVYQHGKVVERVTVEWQFMKGGKTGKTAWRTVSLHPELQAALSIWLETVQKRRGSLDPDLPVFHSRNKAVDGTPRAISRMQAWNILTDAYEANGLTGKLGTHALRKTFAMRMSGKLKHNLVTTQRTLGHANINSTVAYLSFREEDIEAAILAA